MEQELQIIDQEQRFTAHLQPWLNRLFQGAEEYKILAVIGPQSSGKSTLLNGLFGTRFPVMREDCREQTTRGIWLSKAAQAPYLVLDVEGTDGRERGENQGFERKSALFSLAVSQVIIINVLETSIGLYHGSGTGLLKIVFEVNRHHFKKNSKTLLVFMIRDYVGKTPLESLGQTLRRDIDQVWESSGGGAEESRLEDFFEVEFFALPHKQLRESEFAQELQEVSEAFHSPEDPRYVFKHDLSKPVPIDGLDKYLQSIWEAVQCNRDLDIPTQRELLASFRCDEISERLFQGFVEQIAGFEAQMEKGVVVGGLGGVLMRLRIEARIGFHREAARYDAEVVERKGQELVERINAGARGLFVGQLRSLQRLAQQEFVALVDQIPREDNADYARRVEGLRATVSKRFLEGVEEARMEGTDWTHQEQYEDLVEDMEEKVEARRGDRIDRVVRAVGEAVRGELEKRIGESLDRAEFQWSSVVSEHQGLVQLSAESIREQLVGLCLGEAEMQGIVCDVVRNAWGVFVRQAKRETEDKPMMVRLGKVFAARFKYDQGLPRVWTDVEEINRDYRAALEAVRDYLARVTVVPGRTEESEWAPSGEEIELLSEGKRVELFALLSREAEFAFLEAKRSIIRQSTYVPLWVVVLLVLLGWNEFMAVIRSPVYFSLTLATAVVGYTIYVLRMFPVVERMCWRGLEQVRRLGGSVEEVNKKW